MKTPTQNEYLIDVEKHISLSISKDEDFENILKISKALSAPERLQILKMLYLHPTTLSQMSKQLGIPLSSISRHVDVLAEAQLIRISYHPTPKGHMKHCALKALSYNVALTGKEHRERKAYSIEMPIGMFSSSNITPPCGMASKDAIIGLIDDPRTFYLPERNQAEKLWFSAGNITYLFPLKSSRKKYSELAFSFEICSETAFYNPDWPSDITVYVNDEELTTFTTIGDFGGRRGNFTAQNWSLTSTQYGILKKVTINQHGVFVDDTLVRSDITFNDIYYKNNLFLKFTLGVKPDAAHCGGMNLFGKRFGDYPQAIVMTLK